MQNDQNQTEALAKIHSTGASLFATKDTFEHTQRVALMFCKSNLVPKEFQGESNVGNCIIALEMAIRLNASPLMVMQNLYIVYGKPGWSSQFLIASANACGKFSGIRYEDDELQGGRTRAWAVDKSNDEKIFGPWVSMEMAHKENWVSKTGSKWQTMPEVMRRYRAATFFVRQYAPEITMGIPTQEEIIDISYQESRKKPSIPARKKSIKAKTNSGSKVELP